MSVSQLGRARRLLHGWSANLLQMLLGITQQVALVPIFLNYWKGEELAAWLTIYAVGNLILIADFGLHVRAINKFLSFRSSVNCDWRTAHFFAAMLRIYLAMTGLLVVLLLIAMFVFPPSASLGFAAIQHFDVAFATMILAMLLTVIGNPTAALYRARGYYGRAVRLQCVGMLVAQLGQLIAITVTGSLLAVTLAYVIVQLVVCAYVVMIDAPRLFPFLREASGTYSWHWAVGQFRMAFPFAVAGATDLALANAPVLLVSALVSDRLAVAQWGLTVSSPAFFARSACKPRFRWPLSSAMTMQWARRKNCKASSHGDRFWSRCSQVWRLPDCWPSGPTFLRFGPAAPFPTIRRSQ